MFLNKEYKIIFSCLIIALSFFMVGQVGAEYDPKNPITSTGLSETASEGYNLTASELLVGNDLSIIIGKVVGAGLAFLGVAFFILMIYGGYIWMFSMGNEQTAAKAKDIIIAAVIGLVIVLMAYVVTSFLGDTLMPTTKQ